MSVCELINAGAGAIINELVKNEIVYEGFSRGAAWNHCHNAFKKANQALSDGDSVNYDDLAKDLAIYLANWGMYRGSSFLIWLDYKFHIGAVKMMMEEQYSGLFKADNPFSLPEYEKLLFDSEMGIYVLLNRYYHEAHQNVRKQQFEQGMVQSTYGGQAESDTLITKILLGVYGCIPAYDTYVKKGLSLFGAQQSLNEKGNAVFGNGGKRKSLSALLHGTKLASEIEAYHKKHPDYTFMKLADMFFFELGELAEKEGKAQITKIKKAIEAKYFLKAE